MKWSLLLLITILTVSTATSTSFGSYAVDSSKETDDLEVEFRMKLFNPGETTAAVDFSTEKSEDYNVSFPENVRVEPAEVTKNPSGSGWYHLGNGRYTRVEEVKFEVDISRYRSSNSIEIPVTVTASPVNPETGEASSKIVYIHDHRLDVKVVNREPEEKEKGGEEDGVTWNIVDGSEDEHTKNSSKSTRKQESNRSGSPESYKQQEEKPEDGGSGVNTTTMILIIGIAATALYLRRVA